MMNADVRELQESARQVLAGLGLAAGEAASWPQLAELGWLMIATPEEMGGLGMGLAGACALQRELGRQLATVPFLPAILTIDALAGSSLLSESDKAHWLERMTSGEAYVAVPLAESAVSARRNSSGALCLTGSLVAVQSADNASHVLVSTQASDAERECLCLVATAQRGVSVIARETWDTTRRLFDVQLDAVPLSDASIIATGPEAAAKLAVQRDYLLAADAVGGAVALLQMTVDYLQARNQFGRPLALFQALKHRCADLKAQIEGADALLQDSLTRFEQQLGGAEAGTSAERAGKAAKLLACTAFATVAEESLQLHGGIGMTSEHNCHLFLKRAMLTEHLGRAHDSYETGIADTLLAGLDCSR